MASASSPNPGTITFVEIINSPDSLNLKLPEIVGLYLDKLPSRISSPEYRPKTIVPPPVAPMPLKNTSPKLFSPATLARLRV
jgi:hypothetical protein